MRCTNATLEALGVIPDGDVIHGTDVLSALTATGLKWEPVRDVAGVAFTGGTLGRFRRAHPKGDFYITTSRHALALRDGVLTDTADGSDRRKVQAVVRVFPQKFR